MPLGDKNAIIAGCGIHHVAVQTRDWEASLRLYRDVLGMKIVAEFGSPERQIMLLDTGDGSHVNSLPRRRNPPQMGTRVPTIP